MKKYIVVRAKLVFVPGRKAYVRVPLAPEDLCQDCQTYKATYRKLCNYCADRPYR